MIDFGDESVRENGRASEGNKVKRTENRASDRDFGKLFKRFMGIILIIFTALFADILLCLPPVISYPLVIVYFLVQVKLWI